MTATVTCNRCARKRATPCSQTCYLLSAVHFSELERERRVADDRRELAEQNVQEWKNGQRG